MAKTAIQQLIDKLDFSLANSAAHPLEAGSISAIKSSATFLLEVEKQQIQNAYLMGVAHVGFEDSYNAEQYYNEKYKEQL